MGIVKLTQFVHPHGSKAETLVELPDEVVELSKGQVLTCECMPHDYSKVVFYSYPEGADPNENPEVEECMIGENGPDENSPKNTLEKLIRLMAGKISAQNQESAPGRLSGSDREDAAKTQHAQDGTARPYVCTCPDGGTQCPYPHRRCLDCEYYQYVCTCPDGGTQCPYPHRRCLDCEYYQSV